MNLDTEKVYNPWNRHVQTAEKRGFWIGLVLFILPLIALFFIVHSMMS